MAGVTTPPFEMMMQRSPWRVMVSSTSNTPARAKGSPPVSVT
jgi:hypothetical protein